MIWFISFTAVALLLTITGAFFYSYLLKRLDNADAKIVRLEQMEDRRHGFDQAMAEKTSDVVRLRCHPKEGCKHCHGKGTIGKNMLTGRQILCICCS